MSTRESTDLPESNCGWSAALCRPVEAQPCHLRTEGSVAPSRRVQRASGDTSGGVGGRACSLGAPSGLSRLIPSSHAIWRDTFSEDEARSGAASRDRALVMGAREDGRYHSGMRPDGLVRAARACARRGRGRRAGSMRGSAERSWCTTAPRRRPPGDGLGSRPRQRHEAESALTVGASDGDRMTHSDHGSVRRAGRTVRFICVGMGSRRADRRPGPAVRPASGDPRRRRRFCALSRSGVGTAGAVHHRVCTGEPLHLTGLQSTLEPGRDDEAQEHVLEIHAGDSVSLRART